ncbi:MAG: iron-sulfur cluster assembly scaffold protein [Candidatus Micrarchaeota archaeon]
MPDSSLYRENILDHYKHPRNKGKMEGADMHRREANPLCGDVIEVWAKIGKDGRVSAVKFDGEGCAISVSAASMLTEMAKGRTAEELLRMDKGEMLKELGVNPGHARIKCALLAFKALKTASFEYLGRKADEDTRAL